MNAYLKHAAECVEEPTVAVDLLLILLLEAEQNLGWYNALVGIAELHIRIESKGGRILEHMCSNLRVPY